MGEGGRLRTLAAFADFNRRYWLTVFPLVRRELRCQLARAHRIEDADLRALALDTALRERGNYDGAAAYAAFVPQRSRAQVVRALVTYQLAYDIADSITEGSAGDPATKSRALHTALPSALSPGQRLDGLSFGVADDGYLATLAGTCQRAVAALPSWGVVAARSRALARNAIEYQARQHAPSGSASAELARWATSCLPRKHGLQWWELAAGAASSTPVFALLAAAARPSLTTEQAAAIERAYFPWVGALHVLLDSLVDMPEDAREGHHSLIAHYGSAEATADGLGRIAEQAFAAVDTLPDAIHHRLVLAAMVALYLSAPAARTPFATPTRERLLAVTGDLAAPTLLVLRARRATMALSRRRARDR